MICSDSGASSYRQAADHCDLDFGHQLCTAEPTAWLVARETWKILSTSRAVWIGLLCSKVQESPLGVLYFKLSRGACPAPPPQWQAPFMLHLPGFVYLVINFCRHHFASTAKSNAEKSIIEFVSTETQTPKERQRLSWRNVCWNTSYNLVMTFTFLHHPISLLCFDHDD